MPAYDSGVCMVCGLSWSPGWLRSVAPPRLHLGKELRRRSLCRVGYFTNVADGHPRVAIVDNDRGFEGWPSFLL